MPCARERPDELLARRGGTLELLRLPAFLMRALSGARNSMYDRGLLPNARLAAPVVSIGNLTVGGTGKTPMVVWLARELQQRGRRVGLLSRGYRAQRATGELNDEGRLLAELLPGVPHIQNPDRVAGGRELVAQGSDVVVLDDGFQHRRLARDLDLVLIDATRPWGLPPMAEDQEPVRAVLPRGLLREELSSLARAHAVIITRSDAVDALRLAKLEQTLEEEAPGLPRALAEHRPSALLKFSAPSGDVQRLGLESLRGLAVVLVSGVGNPRAFEATARSCGADVQAVHTFPDHHAFTRAELEPLMQAGASLLVTSKDSVKLTELSIAHAVLEVELCITRGAQVLAALVDALPMSTEQHERAALHEGLHG